MRRTWLGLAYLAASTVPLCGQEIASMRANIRGGGGANGGKCTIEVSVDDVAEVEINGDQGRVRTLAGQPSQWRRFECSGVLPDRLADFRLQGVNGRGKVQLVRDPRENRGVAVLRIEDPQSGRGNYSFDLLWQGQGGGPDRGDNRRDAPDDRRDDRRADGDRGRDGGGGAQAVTLACNSDDMRRHYCDADTRRGVRLVRQRSEAECKRDYSWGYDQRGIWVDRGCRADFEVSR